MPFYRGGFEQIKVAAFLSPKRNDDDHTLKIMAAHGGSRHVANSVSFQKTELPQ